MYTDKVYALKGHKMRKVALAFLVICLSGCSFTFEQSERELKDLEYTRKAAKNYLEIAPMQIGFVKGSMGPDIEKLPTSTLEAIDELHDLAMDPNSCGDFEYGYSLGLRVRITNDIIKKILERYAPEILRYWP